LIVLRYFDVTLGLDVHNLNINSSISFLAVEKVL